MERVTVQIAAIPARPARGGLAFDHFRRCGIERLIRDFDLEPIADRVRWHDTVRVDPQRPDSWLKRPRHVAWSRRMSGQDQIAVRIVVACPPPTLWIKQGQAQIVANRMALRLFGGVIEAKLQAGLARGPLEPLGDVVLGLWITKGALESPLK